MLSKLTNHLAGQPMFLLKQKISQYESEGRRIIHLEIGDAVWNAPDVVKKAAIDSINNNETHYALSGGTSELKEAIAKDTQKEYGFTPSHDEIVVMPANAIIDFVARCTCNKGDRVFIPNPCFPTYISVVKYLGLKIHPNGKLIILNSPSNPTGEMMEKWEILSAINSGNWVLLDDVYSKLVFDNIEKPDYSKVDRNKLIILKSFSKTYSMAGFRLGYAICNKVLAEKLMLLFQTIFSCMPIFIQKAGIAALENEEQFLPERLKYLKECRDIMVDGLNNNGIKCPSPKGAFYVFPDVSKTRLTEDLLLKNNVATLDGKCFGSNGIGHLRMCFAREKTDLWATLDIIRKIV
jgi:aspartate aminotransferase